MFGIIGTLIFYIVVIAICYISLGYYEKHNTQKIWLISTYLFLFLISAIRYDIGNDYNNYVNIIDGIVADFHSNESFISILINYLWADVALVVMSCLCSWMTHPFIGVYLIVSIINTYLLFKVCERYNCHKLGVLVFILAGYLFITWDGARQGSAILMFLFALTYIEQKKMIKYIVSILIAALFHKSALFLLPCYFFAYLKLKDWMYYSIVMVILLIYWTGLIDNIQSDALDLLAYGGDYYSKYADSSIASSEAILSVKYKLRTTFIMGLWTIILGWLPKEKFYLKNLIVFGIMFALVGNGSLTFLRISWYFLISLVIATPFAYKNIRTSPNKRLVLKFGFFVVFLLLCRDIYIVQDRGCTPYDTVFSTNFERGYFRPDR